MRSHAGCPGLGGYPERCGAAGMPVNSEALYRAIAKPDTV